MMLVAATPQEQSARDRLSAATWGGGLTVDAHVRREAALRGTAFAKLALTTWLWVAEDGEVLASAETYLNEAFLDGAARRVASIATVYTEPRLRGRGHATALLPALLDATRADTGLLFSDVGTAMYERLGFVALDAWDRVDDAATGRPNGVRWLDRASLRWPRDTRRLDGFVMSVTADRVQWHLTEAALTARALHRPIPGSCGATLGASRIAWAVNSPARELRILDFQVDGGAPGDAEVLWRAARHVAAESGLMRVRAWETPGWPEGIGVRERRDGQVPMLRLAAPWKAEAVRMPRALWV